MRRLPPGRERRAKVLGRPFRPRREFWSAPPPKESKVVDGATGRGQDRGSSGRPGGVVRKAARGAGRGRAAFPARPGGLRPRHLAAARPAPGERRCLARTVSDRIVARRGKRPRRPTRPRLNAEGVKRPSAALVPPEGFALLQAPTAPGEESRAPRGRAGFRVGPSRVIAWASPWENGALDRARPRPDLRRARPFAKGSLNSARPMIRVDSGRTPSTPYRPIIAERTTRIDLAPATWPCGAARHLPPTIPKARCSTLTEANINR